MNIEEKFSNKRLDRFAREGCQYVIFSSSLISWKMMTMLKLVENHLNLHGKTHFQMPNPNKVVLKKCNECKGVKFEVFRKMIIC